MNNKIPRKLISLLLVITKKGAQKAVEKSITRTKFNAHVMK